MNITVMRKFLSEWFQWKTCITWVVIITVLVFCGRESTKPCPQPVSKMVLVNLEDGTMQSTTSQTWVSIDDALESQRTQVADLRKALAFQREQTTTANETITRLIREKASLIQQLNSKE